MQKETKEAKIYAHLIFFMTATGGLIFILYGGILAIRTANESWQSALTGVHMLWFGIGALLCVCAWAMAGDPEKE